jgi:hypothetical protein
MEAGVLTPAETLRKLRERGYTARREGDRLVVEGPTPKRDERARAAIVAQRDELLGLLDAERHPTVAAALEVFADARLIEVRSIARRARA